MTDNQDSGAELPNRWRESYDIEKSRTATFVFRVLSRLVPILVILFAVIAGVSLVSKLWKLVTN